MKYVRCNFFVDEEWFFCQCDCFFIIEWLFFCVCLMKMFEKLNFFWNEFFFWAEWFFFCLLWMIFMFFVMRIFRKLNFFLKECFFCLNDCFFVWMIVFCLIKARSWMQIRKWTGFKVKKDYCRPVSKTNPFKGPVFFLVCILRSDFI